MDKLGELKRALELNKISRRDFMTQAAAIGGTAALSTSLMSGTALAAPKRGGRNVLRAARKIRLGPASRSSRAVCRAMSEFAHCSQFEGEEHDRIFSSHHRCAG